MKTSFILSLVLFALSIVLTATVHWQAWRTIDWVVLEWLQSNLPRSVDLPFSMLSLLGSVEITTLIVFALVLLAPPRRRIPLIVAFGSMMLVEVIGKSLISQPIPPRELLRSVPFFWLLSGKIKTAYAFPSGHAARTVFIVVISIALVAASRLSSRIKFVFYLLVIFGAAVMLVSRVYLVEHWLSDVIGGALLGGAFALGSLVWKTKFPNDLIRRFF